MVVEKAQGESGNAGYGALNAWARSLGQIHSTNDSRRNKIPNGPVTVTETAPEGTNLCRRQI